jgi:choline kinase
VNLIILAAGIGRRLYPLTKDTPKSLLDLGDGDTLLDKQLEIAALHDEIDKVYVISGYRTEQIEARLEEHKHKLDVDVIFNPFFDISNNLISLWCANHLFLGKDFLVSNGDNIYKSHVYGKIIGDNREGIHLVIDHKDKYDADDMKVLLQEGSIERVSKKIHIDEAQAESVGFIRVTGESSRRQFYDMLMSMVKDLDRRDDFWLEVFNCLVESGITVTPIEIDEHDWGEMDYHPDINAMRQAITENIF